MLGQYDDAMRSPRCCLKVMWQAVRVAFRAEAHNAASSLLVEQSLDKVFGRLRDVLPGLACEGGLLCQNGLPAPTCVRVDKTTSLFTCQNYLLNAASRQQLTVPKACAQAMQIAIIGLANQAHVACNTYCLLDAVLHVTNAQLLLSFSSAVQCMHPIVHCLLVHLHPLLTQHVVLTRLQIGQASGVCACHQMATDR